MSKSARDVLEARGALKGQVVAARIDGDVRDLTAPVPDSVAEVAFVGRSNVGKSSLINALANQKQLARVSNTPGRTQLINLFELTEGADGVTVVTTSRDGSVRLWDVALGRPIGGPLTAHDDEVWRVTTHPDDARFVTSSRDGTVRIWDVLDRDRACERAEGAFDEDQRRTYLGPGETAAGCG